MLIMVQLRVSWLVVSDRIPPQEDLPGLVALLSEQISDVKSAIDDLKQGLASGLHHLEVRLDDHAVRLTNLERSEIRREEADRVRAQMQRSVSEAFDDRVQQEHLGLTRIQVRIGWISVMAACATIVIAELKGLF